MTINSDSLIDSAPPSVALFFSHGTTLQAWDQGGLFDREVGYYRHLQHHLGKITFVTYDHPSATAVALTNRLKPISVLWNSWRLHYRFFGILAPFIHYRSLKRYSLFKTNQISGAWTGVIAKWLLRKPLVVRSGYIWSQFAALSGKRGLRGRLVPIVEHFVLKAADVILVATEADKEYVLAKHHLSPDNVCVLPNPIDTETFSPDSAIAKERGLVTYVGRLAPQKNLGILIEAVLQVPEARLLIAGSGPEEPYLRSVAGSSDRVEFSGSIPNREVPKVLNRSEVFVLPSSYEGSPKALLEAMACGLPVIGASAPGIKNVITNGSNGLISELIPEKLAANIKRLLADVDLRDELGLEARRQVVENHSASAVAAKEASILAEIAVRR